MKQTIILLAVLVGLECQSQQKENVKQNAGVIEIVKFKLKSGLTPEEGKEKLLHLDECVRHFEGFIERNLTVNENGEWVDIVYWTSLKHALSAAELVAKDPKALESFAVIDESSMIMHHYSLVHKFNNN